MAKYSSTTKKIYVVTGGAGFIGSAMVWNLNQLGIDRIWVVDELGIDDKWKNLRGLRYLDFVHKDDFIDLLDGKNVSKSIAAIIHMGACSATTERDADYLMENNFRYTQHLALWSLKNKIRFLYASSAATYGDGSLGYSDDDKLTPTLLPLNMYGYSKQLFDTWVLKNKLQNTIAGFKFFNVYGPNEYHKQDMMSVICKAYTQIGESGKLKLFKSYKPEYGDGGQQRDFVYVKDVVEVMAWFLLNPRANGIFNLGTGQARTWNDLAKATFMAMTKPVQIEYIDMPESIRDRYQYFTLADNTKLSKAGCKHKFMSLEDGVRDYVASYLSKVDNPYLGG